MKYGESVFDIAYLLFAILIGIVILRKRNDPTDRLLGGAVLILGCGDAFHLIPRVLNYFISGDFTAGLGFGKLATSVTMTVFYLLMYRLWIRLYGEEENRTLSVTVYVVVAIRIILCLMPQNRWFSNDGSVMWGVIRNIPFVALGIIDIWLFFQKRKEIRRFRPIWLLITLSFLFYIPVAVGASLVPLLGMLMLPKTVCYMLIIWIFWRYSIESKD